MQTLFFTLLAFSILVTIHELGHYLVARWCGIKVLRFSLGIGKVIYSRRFGADQTEWVISALPLGGYVKMLDVREAASDPDAKPIAPEEMVREFTSQSVWKRIAIVIAGPISNFLLAIFLFAAMFSYGISEISPRIRVPSHSSTAYQAGLRQGDLIEKINDKKIATWAELRAELTNFALEKSVATISVLRAQDQSSPARIIVQLPLAQVNADDLEGDFLNKLGLSLASPPPILKQVSPDGPAERASLKNGDRILTVNGNSVLDGQDFTEIIARSAGEKLSLLVERDRRNIELNVIPETQYNNGQASGKIKVLLMPPESRLVRRNPFEAITKGVEQTWNISALTLRMMGQMVTGQVSWKHISGPLTIAEYAGQSARTSAMSYIGFIALISISLGVMNLLPIPMLDGGHLLYYSLELLTGKPLSERLTERLQRVGIAFLVTLMIVAFYNDITRQWHNAGLRQQAVQSSR